jgi:hypothetical protein
MAGLDREQISQYLADLGMGEALIERGLSVVDDLESLVSDPIEHVFVSEYRDDEGNRHYESLWLFTQNYMSEAQNFLTDAISFDLVPARLGIARIEVSRESFDLATASEQSRLSVNVSFSASSHPGIMGTFKASASNCEVLTEIVRKYLMPLLGTTQ